MWRRDTKEILKWWSTHKSPSTKGGDDNFNQICHILSTKRKSRRWPMVIFNNLLEKLGIASQIIDIDLFQGIVLQKKNYKRSEFQENLAKTRSVEHIYRRWAKLRKLNVLLGLSIQHMSEVWKIQRPSQSEQSRNTPAPSKRRKAVQGRCLSF